MPFQAGQQIKMQECVGIRGCSN